MKKCKKRGCSEMIGMCPNGLCNMHCTHSEIVWPRRTVLAWKFSGMLWSWVVALTTVVLVTDLCLRVIVGWWVMIGF